MAKKSDQELMAESVEILWKQYDQMKLITEQMWTHLWRLQKKIVNMTEEEEEGSGEIAKKRFLNMAEQRRSSGVLVIVKIGN